jgi:PKD repeat protein
MLREREMVPDKGGRVNINMPTTTRARRESARRTARRSVGLAAARPASRVEPLESRVLFSADAIRDAAGFSTNTLGPTDDKSLMASLDFSVDFYGGSYDTLFVNNNGNLTFGAGLTRYETTSLDMLTSKMIAPFFADVDTRAGASPTTYGMDMIDGHMAFGVNYLNVNYFPSATPHVNRNSFQVVLIDRSDIRAGDFDLEFNYGSIQWESAGIAGGDANGLGGISARVGFTAGTGMEGTFFELGGSGMPGSFLDSNMLMGLANTSMNSDVAGRYVFAFRNGGWQFAVPNTAPSVSVPGDVELTEGADGRTSLPLGFAGLFVDPDNDQWTATVDYGDGAGSHALALNEDKSFSLDHTYENAGIYTVSVTVSDGNGGDSSSQFQVSVVDRSAPVVNVAVPGAVVEGGSVVLRASTMNDPDLNDTFNFKWLIDGVSAGTGTELTLGVADSGTLNVTLIAMDQAGNQTVVHVPVVVGNAAPTANFVASSGSVNEGGSVNFSFTNAADASAVDMAAGLTYSYDFDGDGVFEVTGASASVSHTFAQHGVYVVTGRVMDKDGGHTDYTATVNVANVIPVIKSFARDGNGGGPVKPNSTFVVSGSFIDPGLISGTLVTVDWGDGTSTSGVQLLPGGAAGSWTLSASHVYGGGGSYTVTLAVNDGAAVAISSLPVKVSGPKL